jgi:hypothetical protein
MVSNPASTRLGGKVARMDERMITSMHRIPMNCARVMALAALVVMLPVPNAAQLHHKTEAQAFLIFLQSVAAQRTARMCERGVPGYRQRFDDLFARWSAKHRDRIARGETVFREALRKKDQPYMDSTKLEQIEKAIAELAQSPRETDPITLDDHWKAVCEETLAELDAGLQS